MFRLTPEPKVIRAVVRFVEPDARTPTAQETWRLLIMFGPWTYSGPDWKPDGGWYGSFRQEAERARALGRAVLERCPGWQGQLRTALEGSFMTSLGLTLTAKGLVRFEVDMPHIRPEGAVALGVSMILATPALRDRLVRRCHLIECKRAFYNFSTGRPAEYCSAKHRQRAMTLAYDKRFNKHPLHEQQRAAIPRRRS